MQYHWVVCFDEESNSFDIDWDLTYHALDGVMFDTEAPMMEAWFAVPDLSEQQEKTFESLSSDLGRLVEQW